MSPIEEKDLENLVVFEKDLEKKVERMLSYTQDMLLSLDARTRNAETNIVGNAQKITSAEEKLLKLQSDILEIEKHLNSIRETIMSPSSGVLIMQKETLHKLEMFMQKIDKELNINEKGHTELTERIKSMEGKIDKFQNHIEKLKIYGLLGFAILLSVNAEFGPKILKLFLSLF